MSAVAQESNADAVRDQRDHQVARKLSALRPGSDSGEPTRKPVVRRQAELAAVIALPVRSVEAVSEPRRHHAGPGCAPLPTSADEMWFYDRMHVGRSTRD